jgi:hypothetical protein
MTIETKGQLIMALSLAAPADTRTVRNWLTDPSRVRPLIATGLEAVAARLGLTDRVAAIREASKP